LLLVYLYIVLFIFCNCHTMILYYMYYYCNNICTVLMKWNTTQLHLDLDLTAHTSLSPIRCGFKPDFVNYKKRCARLATACDKVYQLLVQGRWFSAGTPASSTTKTGRHDRTEILLKVALKRQKSNQIEEV